MIDNFSLALTHVLLLLVAWRVLRRSDLDEDAGAEAPAHAGRRWPFGKGGSDA
ncbi:MAG: hypothetical protein QOJ27_455 [Sphingomonadales bacterium]|jgi:hypothetical protein|nr:hypothetical protein [Sphingomonadales bacterium]